MKIKTIYQKLIFTILSTSMLVSCGNSTNTKTDSDPTSTDVSFGSVTPTSGETAGGTMVTITGANFEAGTTVAFGQEPCTDISIQSAGSLTCVTPANSTGSVSITLTNPDATSDTAADAFVYGSVPPTFSAVTPTGFINTQSTLITISGTGYTSGMTVTVGGADCTSVVVNSASELTCMSPTGASAGAFDIVVTNPSAVSATGLNAFTFRTPPTLTTLKAAGPQGAFQSCQGCHGGNGGLTISNYSTVSARVVAGSPSTSLIWQRMNGMNGSLMPQGGPMRPPSEIQALEDWILDGAQDN